MNAPPPVYTVLCQKADGTWRTFACYRDPQEAEAVAARLRALGANAKADILPCDAEPAQKLARRT